MMGLPPFFFGLIAAIGGGVGVPGTTTGLVGAAVGAGAGARAVWGGGLVMTPPGRRRLSAIAGLMAIVANTNSDTTRLTALAEFFQLRFMPVSSCDMPDRRSGMFRYTAVVAIDPYSWGWSLGLAQRLQI